MKLNFYIEYDNPRLPIENLSQILTAYAVIHNGMNFMLDGDPEDFQRRIAYLDDLRRKAFYPPQPVTLTPLPGDDLNYLPEGLYRFGEDLFSSAESFHRLERDLYPGADLPLQTILRSMNFFRTPEVTSLRKGSLEGEIAKILRRLRKLFAGAIASSSVLPEGRKRNGEEELAFFLDRLGTEAKNQTSRYIGAGIVGVGAGVLALNYRELEVRGVKTATSDDDDDEEPAYARAGQA